MTITELTPIGDIAAALPSSVRVFQRHGIDFCCGGKRALGTVCREQGLSFAKTVEDIQASARRAGDDRDWRKESLAALIDHIVATYHGSLREELPRLRTMASQVARVHASKAGYLVRISEIVEALSDDLMTHMGKEEAVLFPAIRAIEKGTPAMAWIGTPIAVLEAEHDGAGALLAELRQLTGGYAPPEWGCATLRALYQGLDDLEASMQVHVHLENNVLFPRALQ